MFKTEWEEQFAVGHERIDEEHKKLLSLISEIATAVENEESHGRLLRLLRCLIKYAEFHFMSEENIMHDVAYPEVVAHAASHRFLIEQLVINTEAFAQGEQDAYAIVAYVTEWFAKHTALEDRKISEYIREG